MTDEFKNLAVVVAVGFLLWHFWKKGACCSSCGDKAKQQSHPRAVESRPPKPQPCGCAPYAAYGR